MAVALIRLGRHEDAAELLESTIRIDRRYDLLYSHLAEARLAMGDTVSAARALEDFIEITQNARDRDRALRMLQSLRAASGPAPLQPVPGPTDQGGIAPPPVIETDTFSPPPRPAPRDSIRIGTPR
jgi:tetratricopeptide (TPR) repeat protein